MKKFAINYPVNPLIINQVFGVNGEWYKKHGINIEGHNGIDFATAHGQEVLASHDGDVVYAGCDNNEGYGVVIRTNEPCEYKGNENGVYFKSIYWHLIPNIPVKVGQKVSIGDVIGYADNTGLSTGDHLHFGIKPQLKGENDWTWYNADQDNGYCGAIDPTPYFTGQYAKSASIIKALIKLYQSLIEALKWKNNS